uniref:KOW domain-containing protein n=1 Tax=Odontella aurita TaxID=265563 RepID=A0A7S4J7W1_9STRA|mmetsp:Transcript_40957/g.123559  ORF Transcript_40957/g.123559 Transcript_40957/m.123559 type:complete len:1090 (+) Transcript_40957:51-3320(+)
MNDEKRRADVGDDEEGSAASSAESEAVVEGALSTVAAPDVEKEGGPKLDLDEIAVLIGSAKTVNAPLPPPKSNSDGDDDAAASSSSAAVPDAVVSTSGGVEGDDARVEAEAEANANAAAKDDKREEGDDEGSSSDGGDDEGDIDGVPWSDGDGDGDGDEEGGPSSDGDASPGDSGGPRAARSGGLDDDESATSFGSSASYAGDDDDDDDILSVNGSTDGGGAGIPRRPRKRNLQPGGRGRKVKRGNFVGLRAKVLKGPYRGITACIKKSYGRGWVRLDHPDFRDGGAKISTSKLRVYHPDEDMSDGDGDEEMEAAATDPDPDDADPDPGPDRDADVDEPIHPYIGKLVEIFNGQYAGLQGRVIRQETRGWWTLDCPDLPPGKKIGNRQLRAVEKVPDEEIRAYNRLTGRACRKLLPAGGGGKRKSNNPGLSVSEAGGGGKKRSRPEGASGAAAGVGSTYNAMDIDVSNIIGSLRDPPGEVEDDDEDADDDDIVARTRRRLRGGQRRRDIRPAAASPYAASPSALTMNGGGTLSASSHHFASGGGGGDKPRSRSAPAASSASAAAVHSQHRHSAADAHTDRVPDSWRDSLLASAGASLRPDYLVPPRCSRYRRRHPPSSSLGRPPPMPPVLLHPDDDVDAIPAALRHLRPDDRVDVFDRTTGKIQTGSEAVRVRDLPRVLRGNAALEPIVPPPPAAKPAVATGVGGAAEGDGAGSGGASAAATAAAGVGDEFATREGRSGNDHPVRVNPGVLPQSKVRGSVCEGREVAVTAGPYRGLVGKVEACLPGGWYLVADLLEDDDHELDVVIASRNLQLLKRVPDVLSPPTPPTPATPGASASAGRFAGGGGPSGGPSAPPPPSSFGSPSPVGDGEAAGSLARGGGASGADAASTVLPGEEGAAAAAAAAATTPFQDKGINSKNGVKTVPLKTLRLRIDALSEERRAILGALGLDEDGETRRRAPSGGGVPRFVPSGGGPKIRSPAPSAAAARSAADGRSAGGKTTNVVRSILGAGERDTAAAGTAVAATNGFVSNEHGGPKNAPLNCGRSIAGGMDPHRLRSQLDRLNMKLERVRRDLEARLHPRAGGMRKRSL